MIIFLYLLLGVVPGYFLAGKIGIAIGIVAGLLLFIIDKLTILSIDMNKIKEALDKTQK